MGGSFAGALRDEMLLCGKRIHMPHHSADGRISVVSVYFLASIASISTSAANQSSVGFPPLKPRFSARRYAASATILQRSSGVTAWLGTASLGASAFLALVLVTVLRTVVGAGFLAFDFTLNFFAGALAVSVGVLALMSAISALPFALINSIAAKPVSLDSP